MFHDGEKGGNGLQEAKTAEFTVAGENGININFHVGADSQSQKSPLDPPASRLRSVHHSPRHALATLNKLPAGHQALVAMLYVIVVLLIAPAISRHQFNHIYHISRQHFKGARGWPFLDEPTLISYQDFAAFPFPSRLAAPVDGLWGEPKNPIRQAQDVMWLTNSGQPPNR